MFFLDHYKGFRWGADNKIINSLWGERDDVTQTGFNGMIPTTEAEGMFNRFYDPSDGASLRAMLWNMIKSLRKVYGCTDYMLLHDAELLDDSTDRLKISLFKKIRAKL